MQDNNQSSFHRFLSRWVRVEPHEISAVVYSFIYFFSLLCVNYILRPMREEAGIAGGVENLQWLFTGTLVATLIIVPFFGWLAARYSRKQFLPYSYWFFIANLLVFYALFTSDISTATVSRAFFIWLSVFNLFVVSVFWSFMADLYSDPQAKRLFGFIAAGGTIGALTGPVITASLVGIIGIANLLLIAIGLLLVAVFCIARLSSWSTVHGPDKDPEQAAKTATPMGGSIFAGVPLLLKSPYLLGIALLVFIYTTLATFLYFEQAEIVRDAFSSPEHRTAVFAGMDFATNALTLGIQFFFTARIVSRLGMAWTLAIIPILVMICFFAMGLAPVLTVIVIVQVVRRAGNFSLMKPAREMLYVILGKEEKYKAKNFIDTFVYRFGDAASSWVFSGLRGIGISLAGIAFIGVPIAALWAWVSYSLGKKNRERVAAMEAAAPEDSRPVRSED